MSEDQDCRVKQMLADLPTRERLLAPASGGAPPSTHPPRIGVWGHYHGGNLGDDLVVATLIANIRARVPDVQIVGFCVNPVDTRQRHGIPAFPIYRYVERISKPIRRWTREERAGHCPAMGPIERAKAFIKRRPWLMVPLSSARNAWRAVVSPFHRAWKTLTFPIREVPFLRRSYRFLHGTDLLIVAGSGPLYDDWSGAWAHPYALFMWASLARLTGTRFVCLSTGAGPLSSRLGRFFVRHAMRKTSYRSYRDPSSARLIASLGVDGGHPVFPDMGFGLDEASCLRHWEVPTAAQNRTIVGLCVMAHRDPRHMPRNDPPCFAAYVRKMAGFAAWLLRNDYAVLAFSSDLADSRAIADVREILYREHGIADDPCLIEPPVDGVSALASLFSACDYVIAARYHCIVLPFILGKPVIALAYYHPKHADLMESMGQADYCLDIDRFEVAELVERFGLMQRNRDAICEQLRERVAQCRRRLAEQYDRVLGPLAAAHSVQDLRPETTEARRSAAVGEEVGRWKA